MIAAREAGLTSVVIVAADSGPLLVESVASALASTAAVEVILVDNASHDGQPARAQSLHPDRRDFRLVENGRNLGFGSACNRGAALARGDALVFLNPDCLLDRDAIAALRDVAAAQPRIGMLGIDVLTPDGRAARGNRRRDPTLRRALMAACGLARFESRYPALAGVELPPAGDGAPRIEPVDAVSGACLFVPRPAFEAVGGFDEGYFLHAEDLDLCRRLRDAGYGVAVVHGVFARHAQGSSSRSRPVFVAWHKHRSLWRYFRKFDPGAAHAAVRAVFWTGLWLHFAAMVPMLAARALVARRGRPAAGA